jgi:chemotaxis signal transduction protein
MTERLIMRVGAERFAMSVEHIDRVAPAQDAEPLPLVHADVEGMAVYGSDVVPQMDLAATVEMAPVGQAGAFVTLANTASGLVALRHDGFEGVHTFPDGRLAPVAAPPGDCRTGMIRLAGKQVFAVDAQRIRISAATGGSTFTPMEPVEEAGAVTVPAMDVQETHRGLEFRLHGRDHTLPLEMIDCVKPSRDGGTRLVLRGDQGWAELEVETISGLVSNSEPVELSADLVGALTCSSAPAHEESAPVVEDAAGLSVFRLDAGVIACGVALHDVLLVSATDYVPAPWMAGRFDGLVSTTLGILPVIDLSRRLGQGADRARVCVVIQTQGGTWALGCDRVVDAGYARTSSTEGSPPWSSGVAELQNGTCPLLDLEHVVSWERVA